MTMGMFHDDGNHVADFSDEEDWDTQTELLAEEVLRLLAKKRPIILKKTANKEKNGQ